MPIGKELGSYSAKATSITKDLDSSGNSVFVLNLEGTVSGGWSGTVLSTLITSTGDFQTGTYTTSVAVYLDDGSVLTGEGTGVLKSAGAHQWQLNGTDLVSDGTIIASESILTLADRSMSGKLFEIT